MIKYCRDAIYPIIMVWIRLLIHHEWPRRDGTRKKSGRDAEILRRIIFYTIKYTKKLCTENCPYFKENYFAFCLQITQETTTTKMTK